MKTLLRALCLLCLLGLLGACLAPSAAPPAPPDPTPLPSPSPAATPSPPAPVTEQAVREIPLSGPLAERRAEISGLAWYGDYLILLPQYPNFSTQGGAGFLYALPKAAILAFLQGDAQGPLSPQPIPLQAPGLISQIAGYEGFEAIAFRGDTVYLTIEARGSQGMVGYVLRGEIAPDLSQIVLDTTQLASVASQSGIANKSEEALLIADGRVVTIHEVNDPDYNPAPVAHVFAPDLSPDGVLPFPSLAYRVTDATALDAEGRFWVINYFFPGDKELRMADEPLAQRYGVGPTHAQTDGVERLLALQLTASGITLLDRPPLQLQLLPEDLRNWEGLARLDDRGFLLATDTYPRTILGFVAFAF